MITPAMGIFDRDKEVKSSMRDPDAAYYAINPHSDGPHSACNLYDETGCYLGSVDHKYVLTYNLLTREQFDDWAALAKAQRPIAPPTPPAGQVRTFDTGATRNLDDDKFDYEGFLSPLVIERYAEYMHKHRKQADGKLRDSDNWQKGIPMDAYMKSMWRHFFDVWKQWRGHSGQEPFEESLCALLFNVSGMLHERLKLRKQIHPLDELKRRYPEMFIKEVPRPYPNPEDTNT